jgi:hypothetical protein
MAQAQLVQVAPSVFPEPQQRALNDALARLTALLNLSGTVTLIRQAVTSGATAITLRVAMPNSTYAISVAVNWDTTWKYTTVRSDLLVLEFSTPATLDAEIRVVLQS